MFEIQTSTLCDGWVNTWTDDQGKPIRFETRAKAIAALSEFLDEQYEAVVDGDMPEVYSPSDFRIVSVE